MFSSIKTLARNPFLKQIIGSRALHSSVPLHSKVAVILAGSGVYDGSEIHEASAVYVHLSRADAKVAMFAPDIPQMHAINHVKGEPMEPSRNVLEESARIARGNIQDLSTMAVSEYDAVIIPGGFGAAKNLSTFAVDGVDMKVNHVVEKVLKDFHAANKPIGLCCIAPILAAKVIPGCEVTVGSESSEGGRWPFAGTAQAITSMGAKHVPKDVNEVHIDEKNKIVTTPAYMCDTNVHEIFDGVGKMVKEVIKLSEK